MTVKEQQEWKIPPCISNWKNAKVIIIDRKKKTCSHLSLVNFSVGFLFLVNWLHSWNSFSFQEIFVLKLFCCCLQGYTIPLDKRLAADGRGLQDPHINDKFAKLAEALYIADRKVKGFLMIVIDLIVLKILMVWYVSEDSIIVVDEISFGVCIQWNHHHCINRTTALDSLFQDHIFQFLSENFSKQLFCTSLIKWCGKCSGIIVNGLNARSSSLGSRAGWCLLHHVLGQNNYLWQCHCPSPPQKKAFWVM